jgi:rare lipoprotein A (peptidoglycan hydrolase)
MPKRIASAALVAAAALAGFATSASAQAPAPAGPTGGTEAVVEESGLVVAPGTLLKRNLTIRGTVEPSEAGRTARIERLDASGEWIPVVETIVGSDGVFSATWKTDVAGRHTLRASIDRPAASARAAAEPLTAQVAVFRGELATWYGPGFFGRRTACGTTLTRKTLGVAHKKLPCGTQVELFHNGRTITVPVIDRGPFHRGRKWDLTAATARALGVKSTTRVGALPAA